MKIPLVLNTKNPNKIVDSVLVSQNNYLIYKIKYHYYIHVSLFIKVKRENIIIIVRDPSRTLKVLREGESVALKS